jgi:hypothetical protein
MKKEIVGRLLKDGHITFDEALALMDVQETVVRIETISIPAPQIPLQPYYPVYPQYRRTGDVYPITCDTFTGKETDASNWKIVN